MAGEPNECFPGGSVEESAGTLCGRHRTGGLNSWVGKAPEGGSGDPLQDSCLETPMDREAW